MNTDINTAGIAAIDKEHAALQARMDTLNRIKGLLSTTPPEQLVFEVVMACEHPDHNEARIRKSGDLSELLKDVWKLWNANNQESPRRESSAYVFVVFGEQSYILSPQIVKKMVGIETRVFNSKFEMPTVIIPSNRNGWI